MNENTVKFKKYSIIMLFFSLGLSIATYFMQDWSRVYTGILLFWSSLSTLYFSVLIFNEYRLLLRSEREVAEQNAVRQSAGVSKDLFDDSDEMQMLALRSLKSWRRYTLPMITLTYGVSCLVFLCYKWFAIRGSFKIDDDVSMAAAASAGALGVCYFLLAAFFSGASRQQGGMLLRPFSAWAYLNSLICALLVAVLLLGKDIYPQLDLYVGRVLLVIFIILAFELSVNFLVDWYRPRFHKEEKSILESRFLAVFTDSGSIAANIAHGLDYQFGLKVTEAGFYRFFKKSLLPLLAIQLVSLYLLSCFTLIEVGERGVKETFGSINAKSELAPGLHLSLPWPFSKIHVFPADRIMSVEIGLEPGQEDQGPPMEDEGQSAVTVTDDIILWSKNGHHKDGMEEVKFVISNQVAAKNGATKAVYNMITVVVPIHYQIKPFVEGEVSALYQFLFEHKDAAKAFKSIASEVIVKYLSRSDYFEILGKYRSNVAAELKLLVQAEADAMGLGIEISMIALDAVHPPGDVAKAYDDVMAAEYERDTKVFKANVENVRIIAQANLAADRMLSVAKGNTADVEYGGKQVPMKLAVAQERLKRLYSQLESYKAQPYLFSLINYLDTVESGLALTQKVIIDSSKAKFNFDFDLTPKLIPDMEDITEALNKDK